MSLLLLPSLCQSRWSWGPGAHEYLLVVVIWKRVLFLTYYHDWRHFIKIDQPGLMQDWRLWIGDFTLKKSQFVSKNISQPIIQAASRRWVSSLTEWCRGSLVKPRASKMWGVSGALGTETYRDSSSLKDDTFSFCHQCVLGETLLGGGHLLRLCVRTAAEDRVGLQADTG